MSTPDSAAASDGPGLVAVGPSPRWRHSSSTTAPRGAKWPNRILLVVDGSGEGEGAVAATLALARPGAAAVDVGVMYAPRMPLPPSHDRVGSAQCERCDRREVARVLRVVRDHLQHVVPVRRDRVGWTLRVEIGDPCAKLLHLAGQTHPDLVIASIRQCEVLDHRAGRLTACAARYLDVPLLAAARDYSAPARSVIACPQGRVHGPTARTVLACMPSGGRVYLAFPGSLPSQPSRGESPEEIRRAVDEACGSQSSASLDAIELARVDIEGGMLAGTLKLADDVGASLIAVPNDGAAGPVRAFLPNLAEPLLVVAPCSVLVVPN